MIQYMNIQAPMTENDLHPITLSDQTMQMRKEGVLHRMREDGLDALVIYADLEHGGNFEYLVGFLPRFEEALLVLHQDGTAYLVLGNENLNKAKKARIPVTAVHMPHLSLPNQPMHTQKSVVEILAQTDLGNAKSIGLVGWKYFTSQSDDHKALYDLPYFLVEALQTLCKAASFHPAVSLFIGENGVRTTNNANEFAHYEFGAGLAGTCILNAMNRLHVGATEMEIAQELDAYGQTHNVVSIMAAGARFEKANMYPSDKHIQKGDPISITTGYKGGLQSRGGYAVMDETELPEHAKDYLDRIAKPYYQAVVTWLEAIHIGMRGENLYETIEAVLPKAIYGWSLNPGHLCADEEWLCSPIYPNSKEILRSGMLFQIDIIPSVSGYAGISCESGILLADESLRKDIQENYPLMWERIVQRQTYMKEVLGIHISDEILPTSIATAYCRPFMLDHKRAFCQR